MREISSIKRAFDFLIEHAQERKPFSVEQLSAETEWTIAETQENITNRLSDLVYEEGEKYFTKPEILRVRLDDFKELLHQKKRLFSDYVLEVSSSVLVYEFFMCVIWRMPITDSGACRSVIPAYADQMRDNAG